MTRNRTFGFDVLDSGTELNLQRAIRDLDLSISERMVRVLDRRLERGNMCTPYLHFKNKRRRTGKFDIRASLLNNRSYRHSVRLVGM